MKESKRKEKSRAKGTHPWRISGPGQFQYRKPPMPAPSKMSPVKSGFKEEE